MKEERIRESEYILNDDHSVYHIHLKAEHVADTVLLVGDQGRVGRISQHFDEIEYRISNREFTTHVGSYKGKRLTVISTGIGTDNIDIVINELDAAVNIDPGSRTLKADRRSLNLVRIGTSGALHPDIPVGSFVVSAFGLGFDGLIYYYNYEFDPIEKGLSNHVREHLKWSKDLSSPYIIRGSHQLVEHFGQDMIKGITATASGFYGPQGRKLYLTPSVPDINEKLMSFKVQDHRITNFEMETSALYGLGKLLGHRCCTCCAIIANRMLQEYSEDYKADVDRLIHLVLEKACQI